MPKSHAFAVAEPKSKAKMPNRMAQKMAEAAQKVMNANQAAGMAQSPEQQLVALEQAKVELQKQKLQSDTVVQAAEIELKEKQLELDENAQIIAMLESGAADNFKEEKAKLDRESRKELKTMDVLSKVAIEEEKQMNENKRLVATAAKDLMEKGE
jgi:hypothetical protein